MLIHVFHVRSLLTSNKLIINEFDGDGAVSVPNHPQLVNITLLTSHRTVYKGERAGTRVVSNLSPSSELGSLQFELLHVCVSNVCGSLWHHVPHVIYVSL